MTDTPAEDMELNVFSSIMACLSSPIIIYHKDVIDEYGPKFAEVAEKRLKEFPDKLLRNVRREKIEAIIKAIEVMQRRTVGKEEREKKIETLKLDVSLMCLQSNFLERRI